MLVTRLVKEMSTRRLTRSALMQESKKQWVLLPFGERGLPMFGRIEAPWVPFRG